VEKLDTVELTMAGQDCGHAFLDDPIVNSSIRQFEIALAFQEARVNVAADGVRSVIVWLRR
jgi:hypothetical protein